MEIQIPFSGFYNSMHSDTIDREIESYFDIEGSGEPDIPDDFWMKFDGHHDIQIEYVKLYIDAFTEFFNETTGLKVSFEFVDMASPKEYNFQTDRIFCNISEDHIKDIFGETDTQILAETIKERHTSYDGFSSFYSNRIDEWFAGGKGVLDFDHNELMTLLVACLKKNYSGDDAEWDIFYSMAEECNVGEIVSDSIYEFLQNNPELDPENTDCGEKKLQRCTETIELRLV